jgi:hypothetical protein
MRKSSLFGIAALACCTNPCFGQTNRTQGAALGGIAGAVVGGIIGHQNDEVPEGALIGGAVGAIAGGVMGHQRDQQIARERYYQNHAYRHPHVTHQPVYTVHEAVRVGVSPSEVVSMSRSGVGEQVIINHIYSNGVQRKLQTSDIISLSQQGVSEGVINAMQNARVGGAIHSAPSYPTTTYHHHPGTVIVREEVYHPSLPVYSNPPTYPAPTYYQPRTQYRRSY